MYKLFENKNKEILQLDQWHEEMVSNINLITFNRKGLISTTTSL